MSYQPKVYRKQGGDELVVADGGKITLESGAIVNGFSFKGTMRFADSSVSASGDGLSWAGAYKTIAEAVAAASAGDTICMRGSFTESVTVSTASLKLVGFGTGPRDAVYWNPVAGNDKVNLTVSAPYFEVRNVYFRPGPKSSTYSAAIVLDTDAQHARIIGNRFQGTTGAYYAIYSPAVGADNVHIIGNEFFYFNTATYGAAILGINAGGFSYSGWRIQDNIFNSCVTAIKLSCRAATITGNTIAEYGIAAAGTVGQVLALGIDLSGSDATSSGANCVWANQLGGTYNATLYKVGASGDQWGGNFNVLTGGVTAANPS
jgi:hypothetical protein